MCVSGNMIILIFKDKLGPKQQQKWFSDENGRNNLFLQFSMNLLC